MWTSCGLSAHPRRGHANLLARGDDPRATPLPLTCPNTVLSTIHSPYYGHYLKISGSMMKESEPAQ
jgi:hypothetical protein